MIYIMDKELGTKYKLNLSLENFILIKLLLPLSYVLYGLTVAFVLTIIGFSDTLSLTLLGAAYLVNIPLSISKKYRSPIDRLFSFLASPVLDSIVTVDNPEANTERINKTSIRVIEQALNSDEVLKLCKNVNKCFHLN
ncbi:MAG: hypothetical protein PHV51_01110 [Methanosarcinaceae archaeon]|nr:hypothetical protein [Methanosarcinaceae archaeon]